MIGIFNRSHYEEVLVTRVHPEILDAQHLPPSSPGDKISGTIGSRISRHSSATCPGREPEFSSSSSTSARTSRRTLLRSARRAGQELEIQRRRCGRARLLGPVHACLFRGDRRHGDEAGAMVRGSRRSQMVRPAGRDLRDNGCSGELDLKPVQVSEAVKKNQAEAKAKLEAEPRLGPPGRLRAVRRERHAGGLRTGAAKRVVYARICSRLRARLSYGFLQGAWPFGLRPRQSGRSWHSGSGGNAGEQSRRAHESGAAATLR